MITYLLVDKLAKKPGWYGLPLSKSKFIRITNELKNSGVLLMPTPKIYLHAFELTYYLYNKYRKHKLIRYPLMLNEENSQNLYDYYNDSIVICSDYLDNKYRIDDERLFDGAITNSKHLEAILPSNRLSQLIILSKKTAQHYFPKSENYILGLNIANEDNNALYPLPEYSKRKWTNLTKNIFHIFSYLGAKRIKIRDITDTSIDLNANLKRQGCKIKCDIEISHKFETEEVFNESLYSPEKVENKLFLLDDVPHIKQKAIDLIEYRRSSVLKFKENLDVKFGLSIDLLVMFQGAFKGGFQREFNVELEFQ